MRLCKWVIPWFVLGVTWITAILSIILNEGDAEKASKQGNILGRLEYLERWFPGQTPAIDALKAQEPPRHFKTHLRYEFLKRAIEDDKARVIVVLRNIKDLLVSYYHFYTMASPFGFFKGSFHDFFEMFKANKLAFGDPFEWYAGWWQAAHLAHVLVVKYEDLVDDPYAGTRNIAHFVGKDFSNEKIKEMADACGFKEMEKHPSTNVDNFMHFDQGISKFYRKGKVGDWKNYFTEEQSQLIDERCKEYFDPIGLSFVYE